MSETILALMQPTLFPWLGYFDLIDQSETFVLYNDVQFARRSWQTRNRIPTPNGILLISASTIKCDQSTSIELVELDKTNDWIKKLIKTLQLNYKKAKYFDEVFPWLNEFLLRDFKLLHEFNGTFIREVSQKIGIQSKLVNSSDIAIKSTDRVDRLIEISKLHQVAAYLSTTGSYGYLNDENANDRFANEQIKLLMHNYHPASYDTGKIAFEPYMSIIDALFHCGFNQCINVIRQGRKENYTFDEFKKLQDEQR